MGILLGTVQASRTCTAAEKQRQKVDTRLAEKLATGRAQLTAEIEREKEEKKERMEASKREREILEEERRRERMERQKKDEANFLKTETEPRLFWLPAELNSEEIKVIKSQREHVKTVMMEE